MTHSPEHYPGGGISSNVENDTLPYPYISQIHHRFNHKIFNPSVDETATDRLLALRQKWQQEGAITVFTSGVYDLFHMDHAGYLLHTKATGAAIHFERTLQEKSWSELSIDEQTTYTSQALGNRAVRLIVSVDGDKSVAARKGNNPEKGGGTRPIYGWDTRAMMVANQTFIDPLDASHERLLPTADAVTIHGPDDFSIDDAHAVHFDLVERLQPDVWAIFGESHDLLDEAPTRPGLASVALRCIQDGKGTQYWEDSFIGKMSTTSIINRAKN